MTGCGGLRWERKNRERRQTSISEEGGLPVTSRPDCTIKPQNQRTAQTTVQNWICSTLVFKVFQPSQASPLTSEVTLVRQPPLSIPLLSHLKSRGFD